MAIDVTKFLFQARDFLYSIEKPLHFRGKGGVRTALIT